jgi:hypothetical protein
MTDEQYKAAKATMPWTERVIMNGRHIIIQVIDNRGQEVPLFTMTAFLTMITAKLAQAPAKETTNG